MSTERLDAAFGRNQSDRRTPPPSLARWSDDSALRPSMHPRRRHHRACLGFTMIEILTVMAVIFILVALLLPAVQQAREGARRLSCRNNLLQVGLALRNYESAHGSLPPGSVDPHPPIQNRNQGYHFGWVVQILPYLEQEKVYRNFDFSVGVYDKKNSNACSAALAVLYCPSTW